MSVSKTVRGGSSPSGDAKIILKIFKKVVDNKSSRGYNHSMS